MSEVEKELELSSEAMNDLESMGEVSLRRGTLLFIFQYITPPER